MASFNNTSTILPTPQSWTSTYYPLTSGTQPPPLGLVTDPSTFGPYSVLDSQQTNARALYHEPYPDSCIIAGFPLSFYQNISNASRAIFSTNNGTRPFRNLDEVLSSGVVSVPLARSNLQEDITTKIKELKEKFPVQLITSVRQRPISWYDLCHYFDVIDLCLEGPYFLYRLINQLVTDNEIIAQEFKQEARKIIVEFAHDWTERHRDLLLLHNRTTYHVIDLFDHEDHRNLEHMTPDEISVMKEALDMFGCQVVEGTFGKQLETHSSGVSTVSEKSSPAGLIASGTYSEWDYSLPNSQGTCAYLFPVNTMAQAPYVQTLPYSKGFQTAHSLPFARPPQPQFDNRKSQQRFCNHTSTQRQMGSAFYNHQHNTNQLNKYRAWSSDTNGNRRHAYFKNDQLRDKRGCLARASPARPSMEPIYVLKEPAHGMYRHSSDVARRPDVSYGMLHTGAIIPSHMRGHPAPVPARLPAKPHHIVQSPFNTTGSIGSSLDSSVTVMQGSAQSKESSYMKRVSAGATKGSAMLGDVPILTSPSGTRILKYVPSRCTTDWEQQQLRTIHISGVDEERLFLNHDFKIMLSEHGIVEQISHVKSSTFVTFSEASAVKLALQHWHNVRTPFGFLKLTIPLSLRPSTGNKDMYQQPWGSNDTTYKGSPRSMPKKQRQSDNTPFSPTRNLMQKRNHNHDTIFAKGNDISAQSTQPLNGSPAEFATRPTHVKSQTPSSVRDDAQYRTTFNTALLPYPLGKNEVMPKMSQAPINPTNLQSNQKQNKPMFVDRDLSPTKSKHVKDKCQRKKSKQLSSTRADHNHNPTEAYHGVSTKDTGNKKICSHNIENPKLANMFEGPITRKPKYKQKQSVALKDISRNNSFVTDATDFSISEPSFTVSANTSFSISSGRNIDDVYVDNVEWNQQHLRKPEKVQCKNGSEHQETKPPRETLMQNKQQRSVPKSSEPLRNRQTHSRNSSSSITGFVLVKEHMEIPSSDQMLEHFPEAEKVSASMQSSNTAILGDYRMVPVTAETWGSVKTLIRADTSIAVDVEDTAEWPSLSPPRSPICNIADGKRPPPPVPQLYAGQLV